MAAITFYLTATFEDANYLNRHFHRPWWYSICNFGGGSNCAMGNRHISLVEIRRTSSGDEHCLVVFAMLSRIFCLYSSQLKCD